MAKKKKPKELTSAKESIAEKYLSKKYMGVPTIMSEEEFEKLNQTIDGLEDDAIRVLDAAPWKRNEPPEGAIIMGPDEASEEPKDEKEEVEEGGSE